MTPEQVELVKSTWQKVLPISDAAAAMFYAKLFELNSELKPLFSADMEEQGKKLMQMLGVAVSNLHQLGEVLEPVQALGRRHVGYAVKAEDYDTVGQALLWTLSQGLGDDFTPEAEVAWTETYVTLATVMKDAAANAAA